MRVCVLSCFSCVWLLVTLQGSLSMEFSRQKYCSVLPCPSPGDLSKPGIKLTCLVSPALAGGFFTTGATWEASGCAYMYHNNNKMYSGRLSAEVDMNSGRKGPHPSLHVKLNLPFLEPGPLWLAFAKRMQLWLYCAGYGPWEAGQLLFWLSCDQSPCKEIQARLLSDERRENWLSEERIQLVSWNLQPWLSMRSKNSKPHQNFRILRSNKWFSY